MRSQICKTRFSLEINKSITLDATIHLYCLQCIVYFVYVFILAPTVLLTFFCIQHVLFPRFYYPYLLNYQTFRLNQKVYAVSFLPVIYLMGSLVIHLGSVALLKNQSLFG